MGEGGPPLNGGENARAPEALDAALRREADDLLDVGGLRDLLVMYGTPHVSGSYALKLMAWRDLDVYLEQPQPDEPEFFKLGAEIASEFQPTRMMYHNALLHPSPDAPRGLYWGIRLGDLERGGWKMDLWAMDPAECRARIGFNDRIAARLTDANRDVILAIKGAVWNDPRYRKGFTSQDVYDAVLDAGVTDVGGFWAYLGALKK